VSDFLAVATATATLKRILDEAVAAAAPGSVPNASVTVTRPEQAGNDHPAKAGINVFLYQVTPNGALRNSDLPTRGSDGGLSQRTVAAVDLHYLLTFYGDESKLEPQRLLGMAVRTLNERPLVSGAMVKSAIDSAVAEDPSSFLQHSNLADQVGSLRFTPSPLTLEELSKLWSVFFQTPYALSLAYQGSVVLIDGIDTPRSALPVRTRGLYVVPFRQPVIEDVGSIEGPGSPVLATSTIVLTGHRLTGDVTVARIGGADVDPSDATDTRVTVPLASVPAGHLRAGVQGVQIIHRLEMGEPPQAHRGVDSNVAPFVLRPTIGSVTASAPQATVTVHVAPAVGATQRVVLLLNGLGTDAASFTFEAASRGADTDTLVIPIAGVKPDEYLVRVQVDGAESLLTPDGAGVFASPKVAIP
jgi:hypothetical protein